MRRIWLQHRSRHVITWSVTIFPWIDAWTGEKAVTPEAMYHKGETVVLRSTRELGRVENDPIRSHGDFWYRVQFGKRVDRVLEDDLELLNQADDSIQDLALHGRRGRIQAFRCALAVERMTRENRGTIYAYKRSAFFSSRTSTSRCSRSLTRPTAAC